MRKKLFSMLALLCLTAAGAWAAEPEETLLTTINASSDFKSGSKTFDNKATVTFSAEVQNDYRGWFQNSPGATITVSAATGYTVTRVAFTAGSSNAEDTTSPFEAIVSSKNMLGAEMTYTSVNGTQLNGTYGVTKIEVYGYQNAAASSEPQTVDVTPVTGTTNQWTLNMPAGNVELQVEYDPWKVTLQQTDNGTVEAVTGGGDGVTDNTDGTYSVVPGKTITLKATPAEGYRLAGWYKVDGAALAALTEADGAVADAEAGTLTLTPEADMTIRAQFAEQTYTVTFAEGVNPEPPAEPEWSASPAAGVKKGETVTVTYTGTKKVIGVKAEKKAAAKPALSINIGDASIHYNEGESWKDAIQKYPTENAGWSIDGNTVKYNGNYTLLYDDWSGSAVFPQETIDAESDYKLVTVN